MTDRYSGAAQKAIDKASAEARNLHHAHVGTEHLLIALQADAESTAGKTLAALGVTRDQVLTSLEASLGSIKIEGIEPQPNGELRDVLHRSLREALGAASSYVATEHLLSAILADQRNLAAHILKDAGITVEQARRLSGLADRPRGQNSELTDDLDRLTKENSMLLAAAAEMRPVFDQVVRDAMGDPEGREWADRVARRIAAGEFGEPRRLL
jgi:ATP-dependent Clp protease ATP-binding subunit ClpC